MREPGNRGITGQQPLGNNRSFHYLVLKGPKSALKYCIREHLKLISVFVPLLLCVQKNVEVVYSCSKQRANDQDKVIKAICTNSFLLHRHIRVLISFTLVPYATCNQQAHSASSCDQQKAVRKCTQTIKTAIIRGRSSVAMKALD